jgi:hypothetical protein
MGMLRAWRSPGEVRRGGLIRAISEKILSEGDGFSARRWSG